MRAWPRNPLAHTMSTDTVRVIVNGRVASEFLINAYTAALFGVRRGSSKRRRDRARVLLDLLAGRARLHVLRPVGERATHYY